MSLFRPRKSYNNMHAPRDMGLLSLKEILAANYFGMDPHKVREEGIFGLKKKKEPEPQRMKADPKVPAEHTYDADSAEDADEHWDHMMQEGKAPRMAKYHLPNGDTMIATNTTPRRQRKKRERGDREHREPRVRQYDRPRRPRSIQRDDDGGEEQEESRPRRSRRPRYSNLPENLGEGKEEQVENIRSAVTGQSAATAAKSNEQIAKNLGTVATVLDKRSEEQSKNFDRLFTLLEEIPVTQKQQQAQNDKLLKEIADLVVSIEQDAENEQDPEKKSVMEKSAKFLRAQGEVIEEKGQQPWNNRKLDNKIAAAKSQEQLTNTILDERIETGIDARHDGDVSPKKGLGIVNREDANGPKENKKLLNTAPPTPGTQKYYLSKILSEQISLRKMIEAKIQADRLLMSRGVDSLDPSNENIERQLTSGQPTKDGATANPVAAGDVAQSSSVLTIPDEKPDADKPNDPPPATPTPPVLPKVPTGDVVRGATTGVASGIASGAVARMAASGAVMGTGAATATMAIPLTLTASIIHSELKKAKLENQDLETVEKTTTMAQQVRMRNIWIKQGLSSEEVNNRMRQKFGTNLVTAPLNANKPLTSVSMIPAQAQASIQTAKREVNTVVDKTTAPAPAPAPPVVIQDNRVTTNQSSGTRSSPPTPNVRPNDNSFMRFHDKRQVRVL